MANPAERLSKADIERLLPELAQRFVLRGKAPIGERSGFGAVWKALDSWLDREVAVKISHADLSDEIVMCRDIEGQTVRIFDYYRGEDGWNGYVMELLVKPWVTLSAFIKQHKYKANDLQHYFDCFEIVYEILLGLADIHGRPYSRQGRYVHADVKPANLFFLCQPKKRANTVFRMPTHEEMLRIIDLGISTPRGELNFSGTPAYDYPKKLEARVGHDLYSLGITFLELLTGKRPDHSVMEHKARIRAFVAEQSSGSHFIDELAIELVCQCARAATQLRITARSLLSGLDSRIFEMNPLYWLTLRAINKTLTDSMKKADLAAHLFPILAPFYGWQNRTSVRIEQLKGLLTDMYEQQMLLRDGVSHRYFVR
ncbi:hypothetical protein [Pseudomonas sp. H1h]|jgi:serine/threonine protein kinase|uniref:protein kinase domain-containing protein n=1 Tax=Pseudomonas sp. H1h TaxID=1397280 RepID=UPI0004691D1C|nr:hypothetical protein [Pseudomonas sp. H1h]